MTRWVVDDGDVRIAHGDALDVLPERLRHLAYVAPSGCWHLRLAQPPDNYQRIRVAGRVVLAHRFAYEHVFGPVDRSLDLHHVCENRQCCNPSHLQPLTRREHIAVSPKIREAKRAEVAARTHCKHGHEFTPDNTAWFGWRACRTCRRAADRARRQRNAA